MDRRQVCFLACTGLLTLGSAFAHADIPAQDAASVAKILDLAAKAEPNEAVPHLTRVVNILGADGNYSRSERKGLIDRLAKLLGDKARHPGDIKAVLGVGASKQVVRQICYRRFLEHWVYDGPLRLCVTFDCSTGQEPGVRSVHVFSDLE
jgi:hypothetical protein